MTRKGIRNHYQRIPLKIMAKYAGEKGVNFLSTLDQEYEVPPDVKEVEALLSESPVSSPEYWKELQTEMMKKLRHDYLHISAYYGSLGCNDPLFTDQTPFMAAQKGEFLMVRPKPVLCLVLIASLLIVTETTGALSMEKFDWLPSESAHRQYPMKLLKGALLLQDGTSLYVPAKAIIDNGWGELGSTHVVGKTMKPLPVELSATWFSFAEDKFFTGEFPLPQESILHHFRTIINPRTGRVPTYYRIIVGLGPEGAVSVWISTEGVVVEVGRYRGIEVTMPWKAVTSTAIPREKYITDVLEESLTPQQLIELKQHGVTPGISDHYSKQYRWMVSVVGQVNTMVWLKTLNGEQEYFESLNSSYMRPSRGLPQKVTALWETKEGRKYEADVSYDEAEVTAAYEKLSTKTGGHPMQLRLEITDDPRVIHTSLTDGKYIIRLQKSAVKAYTRR